MPFRLSGQDQGQPGQAGRAAFRVFGVVCLWGMAGGSPSVPTIDVNLITKWRGEVVAVKKQQWWKIGDGEMASGFLLISRAAPHNVAVVRRTMLQVCVCSLAAPETASKKSRQKHRRRPQHFRSVTDNESETSNINLCFGGIS